MSLFYGPIANHSSSAQGVSCPGGGVGRDTHDRFLLPVTMIREKNCDSFYHLLNHVQHP